ncbi:MAG: hypothetical protein AB7S72_11375 [Draconibacterium sp.]
MKQIVIQVPESKYSFFVELIKNLGFVKIQSEKKLYTEQEVLLDELNESLHLVEKHIKGEIKLKSAEELLDEL